MFCLSWPSQLCALHNSRAYCNLDRYILGSSLAFAFSGRGELSHRHCRSRLRVLLFVFVLRAPRAPQDTARNGRQSSAATGSRPPTKVNLISTVSHSVQNADGVPGKGFRDHGGSLRMVKLFQTVGFAMLQVEYRSYAPMKRREWLIVSGTK